MTEMEINLIRDVVFYVVVAVCVWAFFYVPAGRK